MKRLGLPLLGFGLLVLALTAGSAWSSTRPLPKKPEIVRQTLAVVAVSRARVVRLRVVPPNRVYALTVQVSDPAAYLRYRADPLVRLMNRLTRVEWQFRRWYFVVLDKAGNTIFWVRRSASGGSELWRWNLRPDLAACARNLDLDVEIDPEHSAPPCPR